MPRTRASKKDFTCPLLLEYGLVLREVESDGACLFRALAYSIHGDETLHGDIRELACDRILEDPEISTCIDGRVEEYVSRMRHKTTWGGELEILAVAKACNVTVAVFDAALPERRLYGSNTGKIVSIVLWRDAMGDSRHYSGTLKIKTEPAGRH